MQNQEQSLVVPSPKIHEIRGQRVMLDEDLATLYGVPTKRLNEQVARNPSRFPVDFAFQLTNQEVANLKSQIATSSLGHGGRRKNPWVFTEHGVAMLSSVLNSEKAILVNIEIMRTFTHFRPIRESYRELEKRLSDLEVHSQGRFKTVFDAIRELIAERSTPRKRIRGLAEK